MVLCLDALKECVSDKVPQNVLRKMRQKKLKLQYQKIASTGLMDVITVLWLQMALSDAQEWLAFNKENQSATSIKKNKSKFQPIVFPGMMAATIVESWMVVLLLVLKCFARKIKHQNAQHIEHQQRIVPNGMMDVTLAVQRVANLEHVPRWPVSNKVNQNV